MPVFVVELDLDSVTSSTGALQSDGKNCYNTYTTSKGYEPLTIGTKTRFFISRHAKPMSGLQAAPTIMNVSFTDDRLQLGRGLGEFGQATITIQDHQDNDASEDPYFSSRSPTPSMGSYWRRLLVRNPYVQNRVMRVRLGNQADIYSDADFETREYLIREITGPDISGVVTITGYGPLQKTNLSNAEAPAQSLWVLASSLSAVAGSATISGYETTDPTSGYVRINDEVISYTRSGATLTLTGRGQYGTTAAAHNEEDTVQPCLAYSAKYPDEIIYDLLVNYADVDASYIDTSAWEDERDIWFGLYTLDTLFAKPIKALDLINAMCEEVGIYLWYDPIDAEIKLKAVRPPATDTIIEMTDADLLSPVRISTDLASRISRVDVACGIRTPVLDYSQEQNYRTWAIPAGVGEGENEHNGKKIKVILSRWLSEDDKNLAFRAAYTTRNQRKDGKITYSFEVTAGVRAQLDLATTINLTTRDILDIDGSQKTTRMMVVGIAPVKHGVTYAIECERSQFAGRYAYASPATFTDNYVDASDEDKDPAWYLSDADGDMANGDPAYLLQ
jgi:hypothetical protein